MKLLVLFLSLVLIISCNNSAGDSTAKAITTSSTDPLEYPFLTEGEYDVVYYKNTELTDEYRRIGIKIASLIDKNPLIQDYFDEFEDGSVPPFNPAIGLTKTEYDAIVKLHDETNSPKKNVGIITVIKDEGRLAFKGDKNFQLLDSLYLAENGFSADFGSYELSRETDSIDFEPEYIPGGENLTSYHYFEGPVGVASLSVLGGYYELLIGELSPSGKTYFSFMSMKPDADDKTGFIIMILEKRK